MNVTAAVIARRGRVLIAERRNGYWEFPGGKVKDGETTSEGLIREIKEELDCTITVGERIHRVKHTKEGRNLHIDFYSCKLASGEPKPTEHKMIEWVKPAELGRINLLRPDKEACTMIKTNLEKRQKYQPK